MECKGPADAAVDGLRLLIVDDHALCCMGLAVLFRGVPEVTKVAVATTSEQAVRIAKLFRPDVLITDAGMPSYRGFETARLLQESASDCRVLFLDDDVNHAHLRSALGVGALGYWTKHATFDEIVAAVRRVGAGLAAFCPAVQDHLVETRSGVRFEPKPTGSSFGRLSPRELEVLHHLADGLTVRQCAQRMGISESTADNHKTRMMRKLGVHSAVELVRLAGREGLVK